MKKLIIASLLATALTACGGEEKKVETPAPAPKAEVASVPAPASAGLNPAEKAMAEYAAQKAKMEAEKMEAEKNAVKPLTDATVLQKAEDELKALPPFAGKELYAFQNVGFYEDRIEINLQDPNKPENIDNYVYRFSEGKWSEPSPVRLSGGGDMKPNLTPLKDIHFADVANKFIPFYKQTAEKEQITPQEPIPTSITFVLSVPDQDRFWQSSMNTDRAQLTLRMKLDGSLKALIK